MPWSGWPTTPVSQLTFTEWQLALRPGREALVGYTLRWMGVWHVFGDDRWVWFNGVIPGSRGAVEVVTQWAEAENLGTSHRHWRWVHWRNPSSETVFVAPRFVLAPPLDDRDLRTTDQMTRHKRIWTIADVASTGVHGFGVFLPPDDSGGGAGGGAGGAEGTPADDRGIVAGMNVRPLADQRLRTIELTGDERFVPLDELDHRIDRAPYQP
jgi:hypothetical protein